MYNLELHNTPATAALLTILRDSETDQQTFSAVTTQLATHLAVHIASSLPILGHEVKTPMERTAQGVRLAYNSCLVAIERAGLGMVPGFERAMPGLVQGFTIKIHRDEETYRAVFERAEFPTSPAEGVHRAFILDPMLATGGTAIMTVQKLLAWGGESLQEIDFVGIVGCNEGLEALNEAFPQVTIHLVAVDETLNSSRYILPGLGDFGDRLFGPIQT